MPGDDEFERSAFACGNRLMTAQHRAVLTREVISIDLSRLAVLPVPKTVLSFEILPLYHSDEFSVNMASRTYLRYNRKTTNEGRRRHSPYESYQQAHADGEG